MGYSLDDAYGRINYHTAYGLHSMTIPFFGLTKPGANWVLERADGSTDTAATALNEFVDLIVPYFKAHVVFDTYTLFSKPTEEDQPLPVFGDFFTAKVGTSVIAQWDKAVQTTTTWRTEEGNHVKLVFLDSNSGGDFEPIANPSLDPSTDDLNTYMLSDHCVICGRDGSRAVAWIRQVSTLNEKLRKQYHLA